MISLFELRIVIAVVGVAIVVFGMQWVFSNRSGASAIGMIVLAFVASVTLTYALPVA
jgi:hypothetical protein